MNEQSKDDQKRRRWTTRAKIDLVLEGLKGELTAAEICRREGITPSMFYEWKERFLQGAEENLKHGGGTRREKELETQLRQAQQALGRTTMELELYKKKRVGSQPAAEEVVKLSAELAGKYPVTMICRVMGISRSAFYQAKDRLENSGGGCTRQCKDEEEVLRRIRTILQDEPYFGYRRVWVKLRYGKDPVLINRKRVQRIMQKYGLQARVVRYQAVRRQHKGRVTTSYPNTLWGMDITKIWCGKDGWAALFAVVDHCTREAMGLRFALDARAERAREALAEAVNYRFEDPRQVPSDLGVRVDNGSQFGARAFLDEINRLEIKLSYTPYRSPQGNAIVERFFRTLKEECVWQHRFKSFSDAERIIGEWIHHYNNGRMHSQLGYRTPSDYHGQLALRKNVA